MARAMLLAGEDVATKFRSLLAGADQDEESESSR
jgi:hypothetical protein